MAKKPTASKTFLGKTTFPRRPKTAGPPPSSLFPWLLFLIAPLLIALSVLFLLFTGQYDPQRDAKPITEATQEVRVLGNTDTTADFPTLPTSVKSAIDLLNRINTPAKLQAERSKGTNVSNFVATIEKAIGDMVRTSTTNAEFAELQRRLTVARDTLGGKSTANNLCGVASFTQMESCYAEQIPKAAAAAGQALTAYDGAIQAAKLATEAAEKERQAAIAAGTINEDGSRNVGQSAASQAGCDVAFNNDGANENALNAAEVFPLLPEEILPGGQCPPTQWNLNIVRYLAYKILTMINWLATVIAVLLTVWGGLIYINSGTPFGPLDKKGKSTGAKSAKKIITTAYVGLAIVMLARAIIYGTIQVATGDTRYNPGNSPTHIDTLKRQSGN